MDDISVTISRRCYVKMILHAAKYPHCSINGLLLANADSNPNNVILVDAVPLFHQVQGLSPMIEVALAQVESVAATAGLVIVGYYHANENFGDNNINVFSQRIADTIASNCTNELAALITINNRKLDLTMQNVALLAQVKVDSKWRSIGKEKIQVSKETLISTSNLINSKETVSSLVDFDNHLDDLSKDYLNVDINMMIDEAY